MDLARGLFIRSQLQKSLVNESNLTFISEEGRIGHRLWLELKLASIALLISMLQATEISRKSPSQSW